MAAIRKLTKAILLGLGLSASAAMAAGEIGSSSLDQEVASQLKTQSAASVAKAQLQKKVDINLLAAALVHAGLTPGQAVAAIIGAGGDAGVATAAVIGAAGVGTGKDVVASALAVAPGQSTQIISSAVLAGVDPTTLPATGAGPTGGGAPGFGGGGGGGPTFNAPSYGGGGGGAVSRS